MAQYLDKTGLTTLWAKIKKQDCKPLYNLGAYDTISGNVITRQTGYYIFSGTETWGFYGGSFWYTSIVGLIKSNPLLCSNGIDVNCNTNDQIRVYLSSNPSITSSTDMNSVFSSGVMLQYKLTTSYTEEIIEGQPLITLDQQGSQWLRDEWEKGLNVFDIDTATIGNGYDYTATASDWVKAIDIPVEPNTTYTASSIISRYAFNHGNIVADYNKNTITTGSDTKTLSLFMYVGNYSGTARAWFSNYMLNEGDHPYPYQAYNGEIVHDKDIADLDKQEYNLGYYDTMVENSDGSYTITRQTGYLNANNLNWQIDSSSNGYYRYYSYVDISTSGNSGSQTFISNIAKTSYIEPSKNGIDLQKTSDGKIFVGYASTSSMTSAQINALNIQIQYKLAISYTEKVEKNHYASYNQDFILDHNKSEAERSANLFNTNNYVNNLTINAGTPQFFSWSGAITVWLKLKPNTTYTFANYNSSVNLFIALSNTIPSTSTTANTNGIAVTNSQSKTFTTTSEYYYLAVTSNSTSLTINDYTKFMLNEGATPLPYQPYEGKVVHEKDIKNLSGVIGYGITQLYRHDIHFDITNGDGIECTFWSTSNNKITDFSQIPYLAFSNIQVKNISSEKILNVVQWNSDGFRFYEQGGLTELIGDAYDGVTAYYINGEPQL